MIIVMKLSLKGWEWLSPEGRSLVYFDNADDACTNAWSTLGHHRACLIRYCG